MDFLRNLTTRIFKQGSQSDDQMWEDHVLGTLYGNCIGDAIGLLTEFMDKKEAQEEYGKIKKIEYSHKISDIHRDRWEVGDWTDDSDQMILIMLSIMGKAGKIDPIDFGARLLEWKKNGFAELGDRVGFGIGATTGKVLAHAKYKIDPHFAAEDVWKANFKHIAPNGGVMRTSVLGLYQYNDMEKVMENTLTMCKATHFDPRCQASCIAVTTAIAMMLQRKPEHVKGNGEYNIVAIMEDSFKYAQRCFPPVDGAPDEESIELLKKHMFAPNLKALNLEEPGKIGFTYKCMGSGFWALRQNDYRQALTAVLMEGGDADTNSAVAGALLGCKLGLRKLPKSWVNGLKHKDWAQEIFDRFIKLIKDDIASRGGAPVDAELGEDSKGDQATGGMSPKEASAERKGESGISSAEKTVASGTPNKHSEPSAAEKQEQAE